MRLIDMDELIRMIEMAEKVTGERLDLFRDLVCSCHKIFTKKFSSQKMVRKEIIESLTEQGKIDEYSKMFCNELGRDIGDALVKENMTRYRQEEWLPTNSIVMTASVEVVDFGALNQTIDLRPPRPFR